MFRTVILALLVAVSSAFVAPGAVVARAGAAGLKMGMAPAAKAAIAALAPAAVVAPAFADSDIVAQLPTTLLGLEVQFGAYLAVLLGTFFPVAFLILLYTQSETRKAAEKGE